ncbi:hypothetical protein [Pengzhenrongella sp.]|uniref:hypothetical protein n=1 Tax=Pengzhenrongella sp. TaxID=2888820 RepID=UPI002F92D42E
MQGHGADDHPAAREPVYGIPSDQGGDQAGDGLRDEVPGGLRGGQSAGSEQADLMEETAVVSSPDIATALQVNQK